jgi:lipoprotein-anchoring transpeptidase ErfK/SrfK
LIPGDPSHGCIRMLNQDVLKLRPIIQIGTPLLVK